MSSSEVAALSRVHDRVVATDNDKLPQILEKLLPGLLPLANNDELRPQVLVIVSNLVRRIRTLETPLPCTTLLTRLVTPDMMPFACNIAITLLDIGLSHEPSDRRDECVKAVLHATALFYPSTHSQMTCKVFSLQNDALLSFSLELLSHLPAVIASSFSSSLFIPLTTAVSPRPSHHLVLLWDYLFDLSLVQAPLLPNTPGSVQPGLSQRRVSRLCHRVKSSHSRQETVSASQGQGERALQMTAGAQGWFQPNLKEVNIYIEVPTIFGGVYM